MGALVSYSTGTATVAANGTTVTGTGIWSGVNVRPGDIFQIGDFQSVITDVTDATHLVIPPWGGGAQSSAAYTIWQVSPQRFAGAQAMADVSTLVAALNTSGFYFFVGIDETAPDPSLGNDGQYASQPTTGKTWVKSGGVWTFLGVYKAFSLKGVYDSGTTYSLNDVVTSGGSSYVWINSTPSAGHTAPNATYWQLLASVGATGATGTTGAAGTNGAGYGGTSTTSLAIGTGSKAFTTQAGLAYTNGARVRATATAGATGWLEGVATYSGTTLTITSDKTNGSGTGTAWNFNVAGEPGTVGVATIAGNTGAFTLSHGITNSTNDIQLDMSLQQGGLSGLTLSTAGASNTFSISAGYAVDDATTDFMKLAAFSKTKSAWAVGSSNGSLDTGTIANNTWYHVYLIKRPDTGAVDVLTSLSATSPTLPTNYTLKRRIGSMMTILGGTQWAAFTQRGDEFVWSTPVFDINISNLGTTSADQVLASVPSGVAVQAELNVLGTNAAASTSVYVREKALADVAPSGSAAVTVINPVANILNIAPNVRIWTDTSQTIAARSSAASTTLRIMTLGWVDPRGR